MSTETTTTRTVLTLDEAAADVGATVAKVWRWHRDGLLAVMYTASVGAGSSKRGPRDAVIDRDEWARFKREVLTVRRSPATEGPAPEPAVYRGRRPKAAAPVEKKWVTWGKGKGQGS